jgi:hypothetical protein
MVYNKVRDDKVMKSEFFLDLDWLHSALCTLWGAMSQYASKMKRTDYSFIFEVPD